MVRGSYKRSTYMTLKQSAKTTIEEDLYSWPEAVGLVARTEKEQEDAEAVVDDLLHPAIFDSVNERSIGLLFAAEAARV